MLKLRKGNSIVNLIKTREGEMVPGSKYCKREKLSTGKGWKYWYPGPSGKCGSGDEREEELTHHRARVRHSDDYNPDINPKFEIRDKRALDILGHDKSYIDKAYLKQIEYEFSNPQKLGKAMGQFKENFYPLAVLIGENDIEDIDDAILSAHYNYNALKNSKDRYDMEEVENLSKFLTTVKFLKDTKADHFVGTKVIEIFWYHSGRNWAKWKSDIERRTGKRIDHSKFKVVPVGKEVGLHIVADAIIIKTNPDGTKERMSGFTAKVNGKKGKDVSIKDSSWLKLEAMPAKQSGKENLIKYGDEIEKIFKDVEALRDKHNWNTAEYVGVLSGRQNEFIEKAFGIYSARPTQDQLDLRADWALMQIEQFKRFHKDSRAKEITFDVTSINPDDSVDQFIMTGSDFERVMEKWLAKGRIDIKMIKTNQYKAADGKMYWRYLPVELVGGPESSRRSFLVRENRWSGRPNVQIRAKFEWMRFIFSWADDVDKRTMKTTKAIEEMGGFKKEGSFQYPAKLKIKTVTGDLFKATLERKKMNAKYIRKELTESGRVRYIYRETQPRGKKIEEVSENRDKFVAMVDSVDPAFKALFEEAISSIDDVHFNAVNAGVTSVRATKDVDTFLDVLSVPKELRNKEEFTSSSGSFNVSKGKMAFCLSNFPDGIPDPVKKAIMMHEVGHAYFYGVLRIKHKKLLSIFDTKDKDQKKLFKDSAKFVDDFGKLDEEVRKKAEDEVTIADVKGKDKEALLLDIIRTYMVSEYATLSGEEHFAEAFSRYFIMPEQLKKKEKEVYEHFNEFFQKYPR